MDFLHHWILETWSVLLQAGPWLVGGFLLAGVIHALVPVDKVTRHLGRPGLAGVLKAALVGAPLPLCSCSVIPVAAAIRRHGASKGATASFLVTAPETGVDSLAISYALLGPFMAIIRPIAAVATALVAGLAIDRLDAPTSAAPASDATAADPSPCCHARPDRGTQEGRPDVSAGQDDCSGEESSVALANSVLRRNDPDNLLRVFRPIAVAFRYGFGTLFEDLAHWLALGFLLAGLVAVLFPPDLLERHIGTGPWAMLLMLGVGLPMYVCATASTPVAAVLIAKGLSPGAALVFLLAGPATNAATMLVVGRDLGRRSLAIYLVSIAVVAVAFGLATDGLLAAAPVLASNLHEHVHAEAASRAAPFAVALLLLILNGLRLRLGRRARFAWLRRSAPAALPAPPRQSG